MWLHLFLHLSIFDICGCTFEYREDDIFLQRRSSVTLRILSLTSIYKKFLVLFRRPPKNFLPIRTEYVLFAQKHLFFFLCWIHNYGFGGKSFSLHEQNFLHKKDLEGGTPPSHSFYSIWLSSLWNKSYFNHIPGSFMSHLDIV